MEKAVLFIDGENFLHKIKEVLKKEGKAVNLDKVDYSELMKVPLKGLKIGRKVFYSSKLRYDDRTPKKSKELIQFQRRLKTNLEKQGFEFVLAGNVRAQEVVVDGKIELIFKEKGVDVKIAVDMVSLACDKKVDTAILCSSDSDLQPAVMELKNRGIEVVYLGFEINPNRGLGFTTNRTILFRNSEVLKACASAKNRQSYR
jgi:uncharacterized LabA/DUF88 family protein